MTISTLNIRTLALLPGGLLLSLPNLIAAQEACVLQQPLSYSVIHEQAVSINTDILYNTTFNPISEVAVTISNAPTTINGITTFTWTETKTYVSDPRLSSSASAIQTTATPTVSSFVMIVRSHDLNQKRQSGAYYVSANGVISNDCTNSPIYTISNGVLTATVNGVVYTYSTSTDVPYAQFVPSTVAGTITTTFSTGAGQILNWKNSAFFNGQAAFCALSNGTVHAVFQENAQPEGCLYVQLSLFSVSSCQGIQFSTITGPPGPSGPQGIQGNQGIPGSSGPSGPSGPAITGPSGPSGPKGDVGAVGATGATGATGVTGSIGPSGPQGIKGDVGSTGMSGAVGATGSTGPSGPSGPSGPPGASASPAPTMFGYLGCYVQTGNRASTTGLALSSFRVSYTTSANSQCATNCFNAGFIFFGTVNVGTSVDCWCGNSVNYVTTSGGLLGMGSATGPAGENNCYACSGGALPGRVTGECGNSTISTIAIYSSNF